MKIELKFELFLFFVVKLMQYQTGINISFFSSSIFYVI